MEEKLLNYLADQVEERINRPNNILSADADPTGQESITPILEELAAEYDTIHIPKGKYLIDEPFVHEGYDEFNLIGERGARIVFDNPDLSEGIVLEGGGYTSVKNITFEVTNGASPYILGLSTTGDFLVEDVTLDGTLMYDPDRSFTFYFNAMAEDSVGVVRRLRATDGVEYKGEPGDHTSDLQFDHKIGISCENSTVGQVRFEDCRVSKFPDNGLYLVRTPPRNPDADTWHERHQGQIIVDGGYFSENGGTNVRVGGRDRVKNVDVLMDNSRGGTGAGIWFENGKPVLEGATIRAQNAHNDCIRVTSEGGTIRDTDVICESSSRTIRVKGDSTEPLLLDNVSVYDYADGSERTYSVEIKRNDVTFRNCTFIFENGDEGRHGFGVHGDNCTFVDCEFHHTDGGCSLFIRGVNTELRNCDIAGWMIVDSDGSVKMEGNEIADGTQVDGLD